MALYAQKPTLEECFEEYTSEDILDNDNKFICSNCSGGQFLSLIMLMNIYNRLKTKGVLHLFRKGAVNFTCLLTS